MKNLLYNLCLLLFGTIQTVIVCFAIVTTFVMPDIPLLIIIILWVVTVGLAFLDKLIRDIDGWPQVLLCLIVSPLRGPIQLVIFLITLANLFRRADPICERGEYDEDYFSSTVLYILLGIDFFPKKAAEQARQKRAAKEASRRQKKESISKRQQLHDDLLAKDSHYFDLGRQLKKYPYIAIGTGEVSIMDENLNISYNDTYTEMYINYNAEIRPLGADTKTIKAAWMHYYNACLSVQKQIINGASSHIKNYMREYPFKGKVKWSVNVHINKVDL